jgi:hypothetical protein
MRMGSRTVIRSLTPIPSGSAPFLLKTVLVAKARISGLASFPSLATFTMHIRRFEGRILSLARTRPPVSGSLLRLVSFFRLAVVVSRWELNSSGNSSRVLAAGSEWARLLKPRPTGEQGEVRAYRRCLKMRRVSGWCNTQSWMALVGWSTVRTHVRHTNLVRKRSIHEQTRDRLFRAGFVGERSGRHRAHPRRFEQPFRLWLARSSPATFRRGGDYSCIVARNS